MELTEKYLKAILTEKEFAMLQTIIGWYTFDDNVCFMCEVTNSEKGLITQLKNKGLIYDSFEGMHDEKDYEKSNWFPSEAVLDLYNLEHY
jgi:hypothetical protein